jgi:hypothetical protein
MIGNKGNLLYYVIFILILTRQEKNKTEYTAPECPSNFFNSLPRVSTFQNTN